MLGELEQDWMVPSDLGALVIYDRSLLGLLTRECLGADAPYSRAGICRIGDGQRIFSPSRRPIGPALQCGRDDAVAGTSIHGRGAVCRGNNELHQSDWGDSNGRSKR
jgi:hypothetical protein